MRRRVLLPAAALSAAAALLSGCSLLPQSSRGLTQDFVQDMADRDYAAACELLSHDFVHRQMNGQSQYCPYYLEQWHGRSDLYADAEVPRSGVVQGQDRDLVRVEFADGTDDTAQVIDEGGQLRLERYPGLSRAAR